MLPPMYLLIALVVMVALHFVFPAYQIIPTPWKLLGIFPLVLGVAVNVVADGLFHKANTTVKPGEESTVLVTTGPFRLSRNPMYLGFVLILVGIAILLGSLTPWVIVPIFGVLLDRQFVAAEEQMLNAKFGDVWQQYAKSTRRWI
jgi:protein-S-isoprenylcysteine O-methyltransferase Ste14